MTCFELSRTGVQPVENPNRDKPKLSLGSARTHDHVGVIEPRLANGKVSGKSLLEVKSEPKAGTAERVPLSLRDDDIRNIAAPAKVDRKLARPPKPFIAISGTVSDFPVSWATPAERKAALDRWCSIIATETMRSFPAGSPDRPAAKKFAFSHRLSIANAFERRIVRADVVAGLAAMFEQSKEASGHSPGLNEIEGS